MKTNSDLIISIEYNDEVRDTVFCVRRIDREPFLGAICGYNFYTYDAAKNCAQKLSEELGLFLHAKPQIN